MSDVAASSATVQIESIQFRAPVSESALQSIGAAVNFVLANYGKKTFTFKTSGTGTYTPPVGCRGLAIRMVGPGAGGGGGTNASGAGGAGAYLEKWISPVAASYTYNVGPAGGGGGSDGLSPASDTTLTDGVTTWTAGKGLLGTGYAGTGTSFGGAGGSATNGDLNISGQRGGSADYVTPGLVGGTGGSSIFGGGGPGGNPHTTGGQSATAPGAGGGGGAGAGGGNGAAGLIIIEEHY